MPSISLFQRWALLCQTAGLDDIAEGEKIINCYAGNGLAYHNLDHLGDCLDKLLARKSEARDPIAVELAIWFHDAIYDPHASDNEEQSAHLASQFLSGTDYHQSVPDLIIATKHTDAPATPDEKLLCDIDLSVLGSPPERYRQYATAIRDEYSWVSDSDYRSGRTKVLEHFLARPSIYSLESSRKLYEAQAVQNLRAEILDLHSQN